MHIGRRYAFDPIYWATEAWFWPGFLPWKMHLLTRATTWLPYSMIPAGSEFLSNAMYYNHPAREAFYDFEIDVAAGIYVYVGLRKETLDGVPKAYWEAAMAVGDVDQTYGELYQRFPQRVVFADDILQTDPPSPSGGPAGIIPWTFRPADYSEVGSPWPNY